MFVVPSENLSIELCKNIVIRSEYMISFDVIMVSVKKNYFMTMIYET